MSKFGFEVENCLWIFSGIIGSMDLGTGSKDLEEGSCEREQESEGRDLGAGFWDQGY